MNKIPASILEIAIKESLANYESKEDSNSLENLYLYHNNEENSLVIYDDTDHILNKVQLPDDPFDNLSHILRQALQQAGRERLFDRSYIMRPFTVNLIDKNFVVQEELFFLDDDTIKINDAIWTNIERELDDFLEKLLQ